MAGMKQLPKLAEAIALFFKQTPEQRMATAQQRAALPKDQGGLGLPADNTAAQRADVMFPTPVWRGVGKDKDLTSPGVVNDPVNYPRAGNTYRPNDPVFSTPDMQLSQTYGQSMPMRLDNRGYLSTDFEGRRWTGLDFDTENLDNVPSEIFRELDRGDTELNDYAADIPILDAAGHEIAVMYRANTDRLARFMDEPEALELDGMGESWVEFLDEPQLDVPGIEVKNVIDVGIKGPDQFSQEAIKLNTTPQTVYIGRNNQYRSNDASFDPFLKDWDHILAGAAGTGILLEQIPYDEQKQGVLARD